MFNSTGDLFNNYKNKYGLENIDYKYCQLMKEIGNPREKMQEMYNHICALMNNFY